ncbi:hypothetical protein V8C34DRAFT_283202 [Trichoderma compactum]
MDQMVHVPPAGNVQDTSTVPQLPHHTKNSLIFRVPISVQLLHCLSLALSYPSLAPQSRRVGESPVTTTSLFATITIPKANRRTEQDEEEEIKNMNKN